MEIYYDARPHKRPVVYFTFSDDGNNSPDVHGSVHNNTNLIEMTNKMQLCRPIYYSIVP
jgi:hypothetical protein